jgi:hypothetical protein
VVQGVGFWYDDVTESTAWIPFHRPLSSRRDMNYEKTRSG